MTVVDAPPRAGSGYAARRLYRLMSGALGVATLVELAAVIPGIFEDSGVLGDAYTLVAVGLVVAPSIVALTMFPRAPVITLVRVWRAQAVAMLHVYIAMPFVLAGARLPASYGLGWAAELEVIAGCAAVLGWRARGAIVYGLLLQLTMFGNALLSCAQGTGAFAVADALRQFFYVAMFMSLVAAMLRAGRLLDATVDEAVSEAREAATAGRLRANRHQIEMLIHDSIIVALLAYGSGAGRDRSAAEAERAIAAIDADPHTDLRDQHSTPRTMAWELQALATQLDPKIGFTYTIDGSDPLPDEVVVSVTEAYAEALRNSLRHASQRRVVTRQVRAAIGSDRLEVVVLDDGDGFDPSEVGPTHLGIRDGIKGRMHDIPGGAADVRSAVGRGTLVALRWSRP